MLIGNATEVQNCCCVMEGQPDYYGSIIGYEDVICDANNRECADEHTKFVVFICEECFKELSLPIVDSKTWEQKYEIAKVKDDLEEEKNGLKYELNLSSDKRDKLNNRLRTLRRQIKKSPEQELEDELKLVVSERDTLTINIRKLRTNLKKFDTK